MKIIIAAGGTGGHVYPAISVGKIFRSNGYEVVFVGRPGSFEELKFKEYGFKVININSSMFQFKNFLKFALDNFRGFFEALSMISKERPEVVLGAGGYTSFPVIAASIVLGVPYFLYEQNIIPGRANQVLKWKSKKIFLGFPDVYGYFRKKDIFSGNPIRFNIDSIDKDYALNFFELANKPTLLIFGGSSGARKINAIFLNIIEKLLSQVDIQIIFITGPKLFNEVLKIGEGFSKNLRILPYLENIELAYAISNFAVARGGAMTLTELVKSKVPGIIIPYPYARDNHQLKNALFLQNKGCIDVIDEKKLNEELLYQKLVYYFSHVDIIRKMKDNCSDIFPLRSEEIIYNTIKGILHG
jgi:UDP-N-acetylglucosamine--N-acetylmuramyl-(pentapeptide) pyrophosphoryl-undecaprenol N-acetylglucosamine transferase